MNLLKIFSDAFHDNWDQPAVTDYATGLTLSYGGLAARMQRIHMLLQKLGIKAGDRVAVTGNNSIDWIVAYVGAMTYGAAVVTIPPRYSGVELISLLGRVDPLVLFIDPDIMPPGIDYTMAPALKVAVSTDMQHVLGCRYGAVSDTEAVIQSVDTDFVRMFPYGFTREDAGAPVLAPDAVCAIFYTSGTVGDPRPVMLMADNIEGNVIYGIKTALHPRHSRALTCTTLGTVWATIFNVLVPLASGAHIHVMVRQRDSDSLIEAFQRVRPHRIMLSSIVMDWVMDNLTRRFDESRTGRLLRKLPGGRILRRYLMGRYVDRMLGGDCVEILVGSVAAGPRLTGHMRDAGMPFTVFYGLTECGGFVSYSPHSAYTHGTVGRCISSLLKCRVRPIDFDGLPDGIGELEVRGMTLMKGYADCEPGSRSHLTSDGWFPTGDIVSMDRSGNITVLGRMATLIRLDRGCVVPEKLQTMLTEYPCIAHAVVVEYEGRLKAIIHPDFDAIGRESYDGTVDPGNIIHSIVKEVNRLTSRREHIDVIEISDDPLRLSAKGTVSRRFYCQ